MIGFLARRTLFGLLTVLAVATLSFFLMRAVKGGPFSGERSLHPAVEANLRARYHLDWPAWKQYLHYLGPLNLDAHGPRFLGGDGTRALGGVLTGDFGPSFRHRDFSVNDVLAQSLPTSLALGSLALAWALVVGIAAGTLAAVRRGGALDTCVRLASTAGIALPNFVLAGLLLLVVSFALGWLPPAGTGSLAHLVLPALALGTPFAAHAARLTRTGVLEALGQDWIRTARAKGVPEHQVVLRHALPLGLFPLLGWLGPAAAGILTGSLVIERIFALPGTGTHFVASALNRDYTLCMGVTILYTALVCGLNLAVDALAALIDPRLLTEGD